MNSKEQKRKFSFSAFAEFEMAVAIKYRNFSEPDLVNAFIDASESGDVMTKGCILGELMRRFMADLHKAGLVQDGNAVPH